MRQRVRVIYPGALLHEPLIYRMIKRFDVITNIFQAWVQSDSGWIVLDLEGSEDQIAQATQWLREQGVNVEKLDDPNSSGRSPVSTEEES